MSNKWKIDIQKPLLVSLISLDLLLYLEWFIRSFITDDYIILQLSTGVSLAAWQVQASLSALTIALFAILHGRIDECYYGLSVRQLLFLPNRKLWIWPNYWEKVIIVLFLTALSGIITFFEILTSAVFLELWSYSILVTLIIESIDVFTKSEKYVKIAKDYSINLIRMLGESNQEEVFLHLKNLGKDAQRNVVIILKPLENQPLKYLFDTLNGIITSTERQEELTNEVYNNLGNL